MGFLDWLCDATELLPHRLPGNTQSVLNTLIALTQTLGYFCDLHTAIDMQTVNLTTVLWHTGQTTLQLFRDITDTQDGPSGILGGIGIFQIVLIRLEMSPTAIEIGYQVTRGRIDQGRQGDVGNHLVSSQKTEEHVLHKVLRFDRITETTADIRQQFASVSNVIIG